MHAGELYDALHANWEGYEDLRAYIRNEGATHGNGIREVDELRPGTSEVIANAVNSYTGPRGRFSPALSRYTM
jgi:hypothetical protein